MAANKREDSDYQQVSAYVLKSVVQKLKIKMVLEGLDQSTAIETAIANWTDDIDTPSKNPQP